jgi:hypothetical protein
MPFFDFCARVCQATQLTFLAHHHKTRARITGSSPQRAHATMSIPSRIPWVLALVALLAGAQSETVVPERSCGTLEVPPANRASEAVLLETRFASSRRARRTLEDEYERMEVSIAFHIIHANGTGLLPRSVLEEQIVVLNRGFTGLSNSAGGDALISFRLDSVEYINSAFPCTYPHTNTHTHIHTHTHTYSHTHPHRHTNTHTLSHSHSHSHTLTLTLTLTHTPHTPTRQRVVWGCLQRRGRHVCKHAQPRHDKGHQRVHMLRIRMARVGKSPRVWGDICQEHGGPQPQQPPGAELHQLQRGRHGDSRGQ